MTVTESEYFELLSQSYPTAQCASAEIVRIAAETRLPKAPELFMSDIHGEYQTFSHLLRNGCGSIRKAIDEVFGDDMSSDELAAFATLVYYPQEKTVLCIAEAADEHAWYEDAIAKLIVLFRHFARNHTHAHIRKTIPAELSEVIEALCSKHPTDAGEGYIPAIIEASVEANCADRIVIALAQSIQRLSTGRIHIVGDVYDRGPAPDLIMDLLSQHPSLDIQWGNHDIVWMGAALGQLGCIAHVVRNCARYGNLSILSDAYGINILPLASFALEAYKGDACEAFGLKVNPGLSPYDLDVNIKIQKAMAVIQFKVEGQLIDEYPSFELDDRKLLHLIDYENKTIVVDGVEYDLTDTLLPTVDPQDPYRLTPEEQSVVKQLQWAFTHSQKLQKHMKCLIDAGSLYKICNGFLLYHACVPLNDDGTLKEVNIYGETLKGKSLFDAVDRYVRDAFTNTDDEARKRGSDLLWYLWLGQGSPLFAKSKMATFEIYFIADKAARKEIKNPYYSLINDESVLAGIFEDFGMDPNTSHIVCGHVPVKVKDNEDPVKCNGKAFIIDGGMSHAYQKTTGVAGFTLVSDTHGLRLITHQPFEGIEAAVNRNVDVVSTSRIVEEAPSPVLFGNTDEGAALKRRATLLGDLSHLYSHDSK